MRTLEYLPWCINWFATSCIVVNMFYFASLPLAPPGKGRSCFFTKVASRDNFSDSAEKGVSPGFSGGHLCNAERVVCFALTCMLRAKRSFPVMFCCAHGNSRQMKRCSTWLV